MPKRTLEHGAGLLAGIATLGSTGINCLNLIIPSVPEEQIVTKAKKRDLAKECKESKNCL